MLFDCGGQLKNFDYFSKVFTLFVVKVLTESIFNFFEIGLKFSFLLPLIDLRVDC